jgi:hypothetical protein
MENKKEEENKGIVDTSIGMASEDLIAKHGEAAAEYIKGYKGVYDKNGVLISKGLKQIGESKINPNYEYQNLKQRAGFAVERHYVDKENADNIIKGNSQRLSRTNDVGLGNDPTTDILAVDLDGNPIFINGEPLWRAQMKFCGRFETNEEIMASSERIAKALASDKWAKYRGHEILVPSEQVEHIREYSSNEAIQLHDKALRFKQQGDFKKAEFIENRAYAFEQVSKDVSDSGISSKDAMFLAEHAKLATVKYVALTAHCAAIEQAKAGAVISGAISVSRNIICVVNGKKEIKEALSDSAVDIAAGATTSYIITGGGVVVKSFMQTSKNGMCAVLSKTNMPAMIATATVQVGKSLIRYAKGEIGELELAEELGEKGTGMLSASLGAAIGTAILPGVGTIIGGMAGYLTSSSIYQGAMNVLQEERISYLQREKIKILAAVAIESLQLQQKELSEDIARFYSNRNNVFDVNFELITNSIENGDLNSFTNAVNSIAIEIGCILKLKNFEEFDAFMNDQNSVLEF